MTMNSIFDHSGLFCDLGSFWQSEAFSVISNQSSVREVGSGEWGSGEWEVGKWGRNNP